MSSPNFGTLVESIMFHRKTDIINLSEMYFTQSSLCACC